MSKVEIIVEFKKFQKISKNYNLATKILVFFASFEKVCSVFS